MVMVLFGPSMRLVRKMSWIRSFSTKNLLFSSKGGYRIGLKTTEAKNGGKSGQYGGFGHNWGFRRIVKPGLVGVGFGATVYVIDDQFYSSIMARSVRAVYVFMWVAYQYAQVLKTTDLAQIHENASQRLLEMFMENKGLYIKLGQAIANQGNVFPLAYQKRFSLLYDKAPVDLWDTVDSVLKKNLGNNYESEIFDSIEHEPIASASIAQVHRGVLKESKTVVAVKIQHKSIENQITIDLLVYRFVSKVYERVFDIPLSFFTKYVSEQINNETSFVNEMQNSNKLWNMIVNDSSLKGVNIYLPKIYSEFTREQVLVSEWIDGVSLVDKQHLIDKGYDLLTIMKQYLSLFGKQIFKYGFIHSDPHPGNLIAKFDAAGNQQLVLLDHGLYITLPEKLRKEYCELWNSLFAFDREGIKNIGRAWGVSSLDLFASLILLRPITFTETSERDERSIPNLLKGFLSDEKKFPLELLFLSRTMRMIQNLNKTFGSPVNRMNLLTQELVSALLLETTSWKQSITLLRIRFSLLVSNLVFLVTRVIQTLSGDQYGSKGGGIEDYIEMYMQNTAKSIGLDIL